MSEAHKKASRIRWENTTSVERARLGEIHRAALKSYWSGIDAAKRSTHAAHAAKARWNSL